MVLDHRVEWCGGGTARTVDVLGARPPRCTLRCVSVSGSLLRRVRHGGGCAPAWGAAMVERSRQPNGTVPPSCDFRSGQLTVEQSTWKPSVQSAVGWDWRLPRTNTYLDT